jgi:hypothetical protein
MAAKFFQNVFSAQLQLTPAHTTTLQTIATLSGYTCIDAIYVTSTDTAAKDLQLVATISSVDYVLGTFNIPLRSGDTNAAPVVSLLKASMWDLNNDISNNKVLELPSGAVLKAKAGSTITAAKVINILITGSQDVA